LLLFLNARVVPWSVEQSRQMWENMEFAHLAETRDVDDVGVIGALAFDNRRDGRMWLMNRFNQRSFRGFGVAVHKLDDQRREVERIVARDAYFDDFRHEWVFSEGRRMIWDPEEAQIIASHPFDQLVDEELDESPLDMILFSKRPRDLSLDEIRALRELMDEEHPQAPSFAVRYYGIWAGAFSPLIIVGLAIPFATTGVRVNPMVGISKSMGLFLLYYLFDNVARLLGEREVLQPMVAAWVPGIMMALVAAWFYRRTV
jgi:lipopolysaccharide export system permease protein